MSRITTFFLGVIVGAVGLYISENYYIVRSQETYHLIPKVASKLEIPYRDIRSYTAEDWKSNPSLALAIFQSKKEDLMLESGLSNMQKQFDTMLRALTGS